MRKLIFTLLFGGVFGFAQAQTQVTVSDGATTTSYATMGAAVAAINAATFTGNVTVRINASTTETATATLNQVAGITSISIRPADTATVTKTISGAIAGAILNFNGADNVTIDGRAGGSGTTIRLNISNTNNVSTVRVITLNNGALNNIFRYTQLSAIQSNSAASTTSLVEIGAGAASSGNSFDRMVFFGAAQSIQCNAAAGQNPASLTVTFSDFVDFGFRGYNNAANGPVLLTLHDNSFYHQASFGGASFSPLRCMSATLSSAPNTVIDIRRNQAFGLKTSVEKHFITAFGTSIANNATINIINNSYTHGAIDLHTHSRGLDLGGQTNVGFTQTVNVIHNTIRLNQGSNTATAGTSRGRGINIASVDGNNGNTTLNMKNNLVHGSGTWPNSVGGFTNYYIGFLMFGNIALTTAQQLHPASQIDYNTYASAPWVGVYSNSCSGGTFITSNEVSFKACAAPFEANSYLMNNSLLEMSTNNFSANIGASANGQVELLGTPGTGITLDITGATRNVNNPYRGAFEGTPFLFDDVQLTIAHTMGKIPVGVTHAVKAVVKNNRVDQKTDFPVYLAVINPATSDTILKDTVVLATLNAGATGNVTFKPYTPLATGKLRIVAYVGPDNVNGNNTFTAFQVVSANSYNYAYNTSGYVTAAATGGVSSGDGGSLLARFESAGPQILNQVKVDFTNTGAKYQVEVWGLSATLDTPGTRVFVSDTLISVTGQSTYTFNPGISVTGSFFVGIKRVDAVSGPAFAYQLENPIRTGSMYFRNTAIATWSDFGVNPNNQFRFMIEPRVQLPYDIAMVGLASPLAAGCYGPGQSVSFQVENVGLNDIDMALNPISVSGSVSGAVNSNFAPVVVNSGMLNAGDKMNVEVNSALNMSNAGTYTFKGTASMGIDVNAENDTLPTPISRVAYTRVNIPNSAGFTGFTGANLGAIHEGYREGFGVSTPAGTASSWTSGTFNSSTTARVSITSNIHADWLITPQITCTDRTVMKYKAVVTALVGTAAAAGVGADDAVMVKVSTNCGISWTNLHTWNAGNLNPINGIQLDQIVDLGAYNGQTVTLAFFATGGAIADTVTQQWAFHVDNIVLENVPFDLGMLTIQSPTSGCGKTATEAVSVTIKNFGAKLVAGTSLPVMYRFGSAPWVTENFVLASDLNPGATLPITFSTTVDMTNPVARLLQVKTFYFPDANMDNNKIALTVTSQNTISALPYYESFGGPNHGWSAGGTNSSWALGTPAKSVINSAASGTQAWVTSLAGTHNTNERSWVMSPCIDFTAIAAAPYFGAKVWWSSEEEWDGGKVEVSIDGGNTWATVGAMGTDWYNKNTMNSVSVSTFFGGNTNWFSGRGASGSGSWKNVFVQMPNTVIGQSNVRVRFAFASDAANNFDGLAFDDVSISQNIPVDAPQIRVADCGKTDFAIVPFRALNTFTMVESSILNAEYEVQFSTSNTFNSIASSSVSKARTIYFSNFPGLNWGTNYFVRVRTFSNSIASAWGPSCEIGFVALPTFANIGVTQLAAHSCGRMNVNLGTSLLIDGVMGATHYVLDFYTDTTIAPYATTAPFRSKNFAVSSLVPGLNAGTVYYVRVTAMVGATAGAQGYACMITTAAAPARTSSTAFGIVSYPNPFVNEASLYITSSTEELVSVRIMDITGRIVSNSRVQANTPTIVGANLNAGVYTVEAINAAGEKSTTKLVKSGN